MEPRLSTILVADVVGYSRLMGEDEIGTLECLKSLRKELVQPSIRERNGRTVKLMGDGLLAEFPSIVEAVQCAVAIQNSIFEHKTELANEKRIMLRIGVNLGDIIVEGSDIYGDGVNVAARLEALATPGGICVSGTVFDHVKGKVSANFTDLGLQQFKNIDQPVQVYRIVLGGEADASKDIEIHAGSATRLELPDKPSIAVLPFTNMSDDPEQGYFSDGITESIINGLARFREILVIGVKSILIVRDQANDLREIGRTLGVANIVEGSVRKIGNRVRITVQLVDAANGQRLWAENYDRDFSDIFAIQDEITNVTVTTLAGQIEHLELQRAVNSPIDDMQAYDYLLMGRKGLNLYTKEGESDARLYFKQALEHDPNYAAAYAGLAISYLHEYESSWSDKYEEALEQAETLARKAITLDDTDSQALYAISSVCYYRGQHEMARAHVEKALELNPNDYHILCNKGYFLAFGDQTSESVACSIEAMRLNPLTPENCLFSIGVAEYVAGRYKEALASFGKIKGWGLLRPAFIAACYAQLDRHAQAQVAAAEVWALASSDPSAPEKIDEAHWNVYWSRVMKFEDPDYWEKFLQGIRKAGLPA